MTWLNLPKLSKIAHYNTFFYFKIFNFFFYLIIKKLFKIFLPILLLFYLS